MSGPYNPAEYKASTINRYTFGGRMKTKRSILLLLFATVGVLTSSCGAVGGVGTPSGPSATAGDAASSGASVDLTEVTPTSLCSELVRADDDTAWGHVYELAKNAGYRSANANAVLAECKADASLTILDAIDAHAVLDEVSEYLSCGLFFDKPEVVQQDALPPGKISLEVLASLCVDEDNLVRQLLDQARVRPSFGNTSKCSEYTDADETLREQALQLLVESDELDFEALATRCEASPSEGLLAATTATTPVIWEYSTASGYTSNVQLKLSEVTKSPSSLDLNYSSAGEKRTVNLGDVCNIDDDRDSAIEIAATVTNTTSGFSQELSWGFYVAPISASEEVYKPKSSLPLDERILVAQVFSDGDTVCRAAHASYGTGGYGVIFSDPSEPGDSVSDHVYLVLKDYYGPAAPGGDREMLSAYGLNPRASQTGNDRKLVGDAPVMLLNGDRLG